MTIAEAEQFYAKDKKEYIISKNKTFLKWLNEKIKHGYCSYIELESLQETIDRIVAWYEFKYPNREFQFYKGVRDVRFEGISAISEYMTFDQLLFRLPHDSLCLLENEYRFCHVDIPYIENKKPGWRCVKSTFVSLDAATGKIRCDNLKYIGINTDSDLIVDDALEYLKAHNEECYVDYSPLENTVFQHNIDTELRRKILELVALKLLYSRNSISEWGYERARRYINEFNAKIPNLNLTTDTIESIMEPYSAKDNYQKVNK